jgi:hypothetical protein
MSLANAGFSRQVSTPGDLGDCVVENAVQVEPVSPCFLRKCREILTKCSEAIIATRLEADASQEVGCNSPYARSREAMIS